MTAVERVARPAHHLFLLVEPPAELDVGDPGGQHRVMQGEFRGDQKWYHRDRPAARRFGWPSALAAARLPAEVAHVSDTKQRVAAFRRSITANLLARDDFIDWEAIEVEVRRAELAVQHLQAFSDMGAVGPEGLSQELKAHPDVYEVILSLVAYNSSGTQVTKWGLPATVPPDETNIRLLADQLLYIGIDKLLRTSPSIEALLRVAEVYKDSFRRRFRSGKKLEFRIQVLVRKAIAGANSRLETPVRNDTYALTDVQLRRSLEYVIAAGKRPIAGIATVFQNQSGGRQQRDLAVTYPLLQERLAVHGMQLILSRRSRNQ
jgi:hypothetical protein